MDDTTITNSLGEGLTQDRANLVRAVYKLFKELTNEERRMISCWFCKHCNKFLGINDHCSCWNDE